MAFFCARCFSFRYIFELYTKSFNIFFMWMLRNSKTQLLHQFAYKIYKLFILSLKKNFVISRKITNISFRQSWRNDQIICPWNFVPQYFPRIKKNEDFFEILDFLFLYKYFVLQDLCMKMFGILDFARFSNLCFINTNSISKIWVYAYIQN